MKVNTKSENSIETTQLLIKGNIICWSGSMIQLSNVSYISTSPIGALEFPSLLGLLIIAGFICLFIHPFAGLPLLAIGFFLSYRWGIKNKERQEKTYLSIVTNSGDNFKIIIGDRKFLDKILKVLEQIIIEGGVGDQNVSINILGCNISGNANVLNDLKM